MNFGLRTNRRRGADYCPRERALCVDLLPRRRGPLSLFSIWLGAHSDKDKPPPEKIASNRQEFNAPGEIKKQVMAFNCVWGVSVISIYMTCRDLISTLELYSARYPIAAISAV